MSVVCGRLENLCIGKSGKYGRITTPVCLVSSSMHSRVGQIMESISSS